MSLVATLLFDVNKEVALEKREPNNTLKESADRPRPWTPMTLTPVGNLDAIQNDVGSFADGGTMAPFMMAGASDLVLKRGVHVVSFALERLTAIRTA